MKVPSPVLVRFLGDAPHYNIVIPLDRVPVTGDLIEFHEYRQVSEASSPVIFEVVRVIHSITMSGKEESELFEAKVHGRRLNAREALSAQGLEV